MITLTVGIIAKVLGITVALIIIYMLRRVFTRNFFKSTGPVSPSITPCGKQVTHNLHKGKGGKNGRRRN